MIKDIDKLKLNSLCVVLLTKTYTSLGQTPSEETLESMSFLLCELLEKRYKTFTWETVEMSFYNGTTDTEVFHINIQTMSKWLYTMKEIRGIIDEQRKLLK